MGAHDLRDNNFGRKYEVSQILLEPKADDIAVVFTTEKIALNSEISIACLADQEHAKIGNLLTVVGWGMTETSISTDTPQKVDIHIVPSEDCEKGEKIVCTFEKDGKDSCRVSIDYI